MMMGASIIRANENATPYAARLYFGSLKRAIIAARYGPSNDIINQVANSGSQKMAMFLYVNLSAVMIECAVVVLIRFTAKFTSNSGGKVQIFIPFFFLENYCGGVIFVCFLLTAAR